MHPPNRPPISAFSHSATWQPPTFIDFAISSSMFPEDAISTISTHRARLLCCGRTHRVIDVVCCLLTGSPSHLLSSVMIVPLPASPSAAPHKGTTPHSGQHKKLHSSPFSLSLYENALTVYFLLLYAFFFFRQKEVCRSGELFWTQSRTF